jgi:hypothetical protein
MDAASARVREITGFTDCYGVADDRSLKDRFFPAAEHLEAVRKVTRALVRVKLLRAYPFLGKSVYYRLGRAAQETLKRHRRVTLPLGFQALTRHYGTMRLCEGLGLKKLRPDQVASEFPHLDRPGLCQSAYFTDPARPGLLGYVIIDRGEGPTKKLLKKVRRAIKVRYAVNLRDPFMELLARGLFLVAVGVPTEPKKKDLEALLEKKLQAPPHFRPRVEVHTVPELEELFLGRRKS